MIKFFEGKYAIDSDNLQWRILTSSVSKKTGEEKWAPSLYFSTFEGAVRGLFNLNVRGSEYNSVKELSDNVKEIHEEIKRVVGHIDRDSEV